MGGNKLFDDEETRHTDGAEKNATKAVKSVKWKRTPQ